MTQKIAEMAPVILAEITKANSVLLHCHPGADPDSVGSVLAMKLALEGLGKKVTAIQGDSVISHSFMHFPGAETIVQKNLSEINLKDFDLFIIIDSGSPEMVSRKPIPTFPLSIRTVVIDHHESNVGFADVNLVDFSCPAAAYVLFQLFKEWGIEITHDIAINLFIGMYTDTGSFRFAGTDSHVLAAASELVAKAPDFSLAISKMNNSRKKQSLVYEGLALSSLQTFFNDTFAITAVSYGDVSKHSIMPEDISATWVPNQLISVSHFAVGVSLHEAEDGTVKMSARSKDAVKYDVSKLAVALGGGGHKNAAGATLALSLEQAVKKVVETAKMIYNL